MKIYLKEAFLAPHLDTLANQFTNFEFILTNNKHLSADIVVGYPYDLNNDYLSAFSNLKHIILLTSGYDSIDLNYLKKRNIRLYNAKDIYSIPIAEYVLAYILTSLKEVISFYHLKRESTWQNQMMLGDLSGKTIGIIGAGDIGREIAKRLKAFDTTVIGYRRKDEDVPYFDKIYTDNPGLDLLVKTSDFIVLALSLNSHTKHFVNKKFLSKMKKTAVIINIARGDIINQDDLIHALETNQIKGAILDVTTPEPLPKESKLWKFDNVLITPHHSNLSDQTILRLVKMITKTISSINDEVLPNNNII